MSGISITQRPLQEMNPVPQRQRELFTGSGKGARLTARSVSGRPKSFIRDLQVNDERSCRESKYITGNNLYFKRTACSRKDLTAGCF